MKTRTLVFFLGGIISVGILGCNFDLRIFVEIIVRLVVIVQVIFFFSGVIMTTVESLKEGGTV